jgi:hypothetical protein
LPSCQQCDVVPFLPILCRHGNLNLVKFMLDLRRMIELPEKVTKYALWIPVKRGNAQFVNAIIKGYLPNNDFNKALLAKHLYIAVRNGYWGIAEMLISAGAYMESPKFSFFNSFRFIFLVQSSPSFHFLYTLWALSIGADFSAKYGGASVLNHFVSLQRKDAVKWAVERGAYLGAQKRGTPLNTAVMDQSPEMILLLLELNADPNLLAIESVRISQSSSCFHCVI